MSDRQPDLPMGDLLDRLIGEAEQTQADSRAAEGKILPPETASSPSSPVGGLLGGLLSNPALLSALPQLISGLGALSGGAPASEQGGEATAASASTPATSDNKTDKAASTSKHAFPPDRHTALLCAIKPYLGSQRRQAADYLISLCRVWGTLQSMGIDLPALLLPAPSNSPQGQDKEV